VIVSNFQAAVPGSKVKTKPGTITSQAASPAAPAPEAPAAAQATFD